MTDTERPLTGLRVLDLSRVLAGPFVGRMLADLGADVVKVEPPEGDVTRKWGKSIAGLSGFYTQQNVGKRDICVDLRAGSGPALVRELATRRGRAGRELPARRDGRSTASSYAALSALQPAAVHAVGAAASARPGPRRAGRRTLRSCTPRAACSSARPMSTARARPTCASRSRIRPRRCTAWSACSARCCMRERSGRGQHIDISMLESMLATDDYAHLALDGAPARDGVVVNEVWDVVGGPIVLAGDFRWVWQRLHAAFELRRPDAGGRDDRGEGQASSRGGGGVPRAASASARRCSPRSSKAGLAFGEVKDSAEAMRSPTLAARGAVAHDRQSRGRHAHGDPVAVSLLCSRRAARARSRRTAASTTARCCASGSAWPTPRSTRWSPTARCWRKPAR